MSRFRAARIVNFAATCAATRRPDEPTSPLHVRGLCVFRERLFEVLDQVLHFFDANGNTKEVVRDSHLSPTLRPHFIIDGVRHGEHEGPVVTQVCGKRQYIQAVQEVEDIDAGYELDSHETS